MNPIQATNISLQLWGCVMSGIVVVCLLLGRRPAARQDFLYLRMLACNAGAMLFDVLAMLFRGHVGTFFWWGVRAANFCAFACNYLLLAAFLRYLTTYLERKKRPITHVPLHLIQALCAASVALLAANCFVPILYTIDAQNVYHRAPMFWLSQMAGIVGMVICGWMLRRYRGCLSAQEKAVLESYIVLPLAALLVQMFVYGLALLNLANTAALVLVFLFIQAEQGRRIAEQENELTQNRIAIMLSQIQPHFLYNSLAAIYTLCEVNPKAAQDAIADFSEYLRGNLDSLRQNQPVPFETELRHVEFYLKLEKMRFQSDLNIVYAIETTNFMLAALTVQPLVENAVKYGVGKAEKGGTVTIATKEYPDHFAVVVSDNGVGYDPDETQEDGRTHIGIENVKSRLKAMCGGTLEIQSVKGVGTTATILLPKGGKQNADSRNG